jgi:Ca2+-binding RTX toxin-like protein
VEDVVINVNTTSIYAGTGQVKNVEGLDITTGSGNDTITGHKTAAMTDTITTAEGNDTVILYAGATDTVAGGSGTDTLDLTYAVATNGVWLTNLTASGEGGYNGSFDGLGSNDIFFSSIERFVFTDLSGGNDLIYTGDFADKVNGGLGTDAIKGMGGNDRLLGGGGADNLNGGFGNDTLIGGTEADLFFYDKNANEGRDTITDFEDGIDHIKIGGGNFESLGIAATGTGDVRITLASGTVIILEDMLLSNISAADFNFFISA